MKKSESKANRRTFELKKSIEWLKREKYPELLEKMCEVAFRAHLKNDFSHLANLEQFSKNDFSYLPNLEQLTQFKKDIERLKKGEPLDYVIGWKDFLGCKIDLSDKPLIPREETEFWVGQVVRDRFSRSEMGSRTANERLEILDLFSGSGCIGIALLKHLQDVHVTFAEKDKKLCEQIIRNLKTNNITSRCVQVNRSDVFTVRDWISHTLQNCGQGDKKNINVRYPISHNIGKFDYIFANPPYVPMVKSRVQKSVKDWEPKMALYGGDDGLKIIKKFLKEASKYLNPEGQIFMEFGFGQKTAIQKLLKEYGYKKWQFNKDQFGRYRWVVIE